MNKIPIHPLFKIGTTPVYFGMYEGDYINRNESIEFHFVDMVDEHIDGCSLFRMSLGGLRLIQDVEAVFDMDINYDKDNTLRIIGVDLV